MVKELQDLNDFDQAIRDASSIRILCVMFYEEEFFNSDYDRLKDEYGSQVHMVKVNTLRSIDIKNKYADGSVKPVFKAYKNGNLVDEVNLVDAPNNFRKVMDWLIPHGSPIELRTISDFNTAISISRSKVMCVYFHNG